MTNAGFRRSCISVLKTYVAEVPRAQSVSGFGLLLRSDLGRGSGLIFVPGTGVVALVVILPDRLCQSNTYDCGPFENVNQGARVLPGRQFLCIRTSAAGGSASEEHRKELVIAYQTQQHWKLF